MMSRCFPFESDDLIATKRKESNHRSESKCDILSLFTDRRIHAFEKGRKCRLVVVVVKLCLESRKQ